MCQVWMSELDVVSQPDGVGLLGKVDLLAHVKGDSNG